MLAALMLAGVIPAAIFSLAADTVEKTVHTDLFVPNVITTKEGSTEVASTSLSDKWDEYLLVQPPQYKGSGDVQQRRWFLRLCDLQDPLQFSLAYNTACSS